MSTSFPIFGRTRTYEQTNAALADRRFHRTWTWLEWDHRWHAQWASSCPREVRLKKNMVTWKPLKTQKTETCWFNYLEITTKVLLPTWKTWNFFLSSLPPQSLSQWPLRPSVSLELMWMRQVELGESLTFSDLAAMGPKTWKLIPNWVILVDLLNI